MSTGRAEKVSRLFAEADKLPEEEQLSFLSENCDGDTTIFAEVASLLAAGRGREGFCGIEDDSKAEGWASAGRHDPMIGRRVGSYCLEKRLDSGGMGVVYLASRADKSFNRQVAIKFIKGASIDRQDVERLRKRFQQERTIQARLEHPRIARLLDAGTIDVSQPYFIMEYVEGQPIDIYCNRRQLGLRDRLGVFLKVCEAVAFAHKMMVVHRDIKPGNILVTSKGEPKLLDFGIAKTLDSAGVSSMVTREGEHRMTPDYASPEQIEGEPISAATDVYSLGVLLYKLLTGYSPYPGGECSYIEKVRRALEVEPPPPSRRMQQEEEKHPQLEAFANHLKGDLDLILLKALRKEPERRYESVQSFIDDLRAYLEGRPIEARPSSRIYTTRKWIARNRILLIVIVSAALILLLAGAYSFKKVESERDAARAAEEVANTQRNEAIEAQNEAVQLRGLLLDLFELADPEGKEPGLTVEEMLDRAANQVKLGYANRPEVQIQLASDLGGIYRRRALYDKAIELLEWAEQEPGDNVKAGTRADLLDELGRVLLAKHKEMPDEDLLTEAEDYFRKSLALRKGQGHSVPSAVATSRRYLGEVAVARDDFSQARVDFEAALGLWDKIDDLDKMNKKEKVNVLNNLANVDYADGELDQAIDRHREALALREEMLDESPLDVAESANNLATILRKKGLDQGTAGRSDSLLTEALHFFNRARDILRQRYEEDHPALLQTESNRAASLQDLGKNTEAECEYRRIDRLYRQRLQRQGDDSIPLPMNGLANLNSLASLLRDKRNLVDAEVLYREVIEGLKAHGDHERLATMQIVLARLLLSQERSEEVIEEISDALETMDAQGVPDVWKIRGYFVLTEAFRGNEQMAEAERSLSEARILIERADDSSYKRDRERLEKLSSKIAGGG